MITKSQFRERAVISRVTMIFFSFGLALIRSFLPDMIRLSNAVTAANIAAKQRGLYINAPARSEESRCNPARVSPQAGQGRPVIHLNRHIGTGSGRVLEMYARVPTSNSHKVNSGPVHLSHFGKRVVLTMCSFKYGLSLLRRGK